MSSTTIPYQTSPFDPATLEQVPVFELFARRAANTEYEGIITANMVASKLIGELSSFSDLESRVNSPSVRLEIERAAGLEEIRVINGLDGTYVAAKGKGAQSIISKWDESESAFFAHPDTLPEDMPNELEGAYHKCIVEWDEEGHRQLPPFRFAGEVFTKDEFDAKEDDYSCVWFGKDVATVASTRTGLFWVIKGKAAEQMMEAVPDFCPIVSEDELGEGGERK